MSEIDDYLAALPNDKRDALEKLRATIRAAAPKATEKISYQMPAFEHKGLLVSYAAFTNHCSFFPMSSSLLDKFKDELESFRTSKGTIQFTTDHPLPAALVKKLVKARIEENEAQSQRKGSKRAAKPRATDKRPAKRSRKTQRER